MLRKMRTRVARFLFKDIFDRMERIHKSIENVHSGVNYCRDELFKLHHRVELAEEINFRENISDELREISTTFVPPVRVDEKLKKEDFLLFHYALHAPIFSDQGNLGDYVQTIAVKKL